MNTSTNTENAVAARIAAAGRANILNWVDVAGDVPVLAILWTVQNGCDGAVKEDGTGFNRADLRGGVNELIEWMGNDPRLSFNGVEWVLTMVVYYQRQWMGSFPAGTLEAVKAVRAGLQDYWQG